MTDDTKAQKPALTLIEGGGSHAEACRALLWQVIYGTGDDWQATADALLERPALTAVPASRAGG